MDGALSALQTVVMTADILRRSINDFYYVSGKLRLFHDQLGVLNAHHKVWEAQIKKFGLSDSKDLLRTIRKAQATLDKEKARLFGKNDSGQARFFSRIVCSLFPAVLESSIQEVTFFCNELNNFGVGEAEIEEHARRKALQEAPSFSFTADDRYVPLEETEQKVKRALTNPGEPSIILLHGESGTGKSSLARNLALQFQKESQERSRSSLTSDPSGALFEKVVFLECGPEVTLEAKQTELVEQLDTSSSNYDTTDANSSGKSQSKIKLLPGLLKERSLLIVLDDVWKYSAESPTGRRSFLRGMVEHGGKQVKWLITSQSNDVCNHLNVRDLCILGMEEVELVDARRILLSLINLKESEILELQDVMDRIIDKTRRNLLALACVASSIDVKRRKDKEEWKRLDTDLFNTLKSEAAIGLHGIDHGRRSYWGAIKFGFDCLTLPQKHLLNLIQLCSGPSVSSSVIEYLFQQTQQQSWSEGFSKARNELAGKQLLKIKTITTIVYGREESWSIHDLLKEYIKQNFLSSLDDALIETFIRGKDYIRVKEGPASKLEFDVLIIVACLYFDEHYCKQLVSKIGLLPMMSCMTDLKKVVSPFQKLLVWVDDQQCTSPLRPSILQVFLKYAQDGIFEEVHTSSLLNSPASQDAMIGALINSALGQHHPVIGQQIINTLFSLLDKQTTLVVAEPRNQPSERDGALLLRTSFAFAASLKKSETESRATLLTSARFQTILERLTNGLVGVADVSEHCAYAVANLGCGDDDILEIMINFPELLQALVIASGRADSPVVQEQALRAVRNLSIGRCDIKTKVIDFSGLLQTLVTGMARDDFPALQENAAGAIANLACGGDEFKMKLIDFPVLLQALVIVLGRTDSPVVQEQAVRAVKNLSTGGCDLIAKGIDFPGLLQTLARAMGRDDFPALKENAAGAITDLACGGDDVKIKIIDFPGLLQALVIASGKADSPVVHEQAVRAVKNLSAGGCDIKAKVIDFPGLLQTLATAMGRDDFPALQENAAGAIANLACGGDEFKMKLINFPVLLQALVIASGKADSPVVQEEAVRAVMNLSAGGCDIKAKIIDFPELLQMVVSTVVKDDSLAFQKHAIGGVHDHDYVVKKHCGSALGNIASGGDAILRKMMVAFPEIVDVLADGMAKGDYRDTNLGAGMFVLTLLSPPRAKEIQLNTAMAYLGRGRGELILGLYKESLDNFGKYWASLTETLVENPDAKDLRLIYGWSCYVKAKLGDLPGALADAHSTVQMATGTNFEAFALQERGVVKRMMDDLTGALVDLDDSLGLEDDNYEVLKHRGLVKFLLRDEEGARADAERALKCKPNRVDESAYGRWKLGETSVQYSNFELR